MSEENMKTKDLLAMLKPQEPVAEESGVEEESGAETISEAVEEEEAVETGEEAPVELEDELSQLREEKQRLTELIQQYTENASQVQNRQLQQNKPSQKSMEETVKELSQNLNLDDPESLVQLVVNVSQQARQQAVQDAMTSTANQVKTMQTIDRFFNKNENQNLEPFRDIIITRAMNLETEEENQGKSPLEILNLASESVRSVLGPEKTGEAKKKPQRNFARVSQNSGAKANGKKNLSKDEQDFLSMYKTLNGGV